MTLRLVIDLGMWPYHSPREKELLLKQLEMSVGESRRHGPGVTLDITSVPEELLPTLQRFNLSGEILKTQATYPDMVLLDPHAEETLNRVEPGTAYIIGGIVDKSRRIRTRSLWYDVPRMSLKLKGSVIGVPDRINILVGILCENHSGLFMEEAIMKNMTRREKSERVRMELDRGHSLTKISQLLNLSVSELERIIQR
ncbi:MAG TPA: hypothetical protein ENN60_01365 [archaeon]|nr:hypothetical protein [archaeon]